MSESIDGGGRRSPGPRLLVRPLLLFASVALVIGFVAVRTDVEPYETPFFRLFFSNTLHMKAWLTTAALLLGLGQLLTAARIYEKLRFPPEGRLYPLLHRWSGRAAILLTVPAAYHCIFKIGFGTYDARAFIHSLLGASFYGAFSAKVLNSAHKRLPRLGAAHGGRGAVRDSYGVVAHFGVLVVRNPRCEPIGYPTGCRMLDEEPLAGPATLIAAWIYCTVTYGFVFGFFLGWIPALILALLVAVR